jgi:hypothetical protein
LRRRIHYNHNINNGCGDNHHFFVWKCYNHYDNRVNHVSDCHHHPNLRSCRI